MNSDAKKTDALRKELSELLKELRETAITVGEECPEGHRRDASGACLPLQSTDYTSFTRSVNDDIGDYWRGLRNKDNETFDSDSASNKEEALMHADEMEEIASCPEGQLFSFVRRSCVSPEQAEQENHEGFARDESGNEVLEEMSGYLSGKVALTSPDPLDGHTHLVTLDETGSGKTSISYMGLDRIHSHDVSNYEVADYTNGDYTSRHLGYVLPKEVWEYDTPNSVVCSTKEAYEASAAEITTKQRKGLPDSAFGVPGKRKFPLDSCNRVRNAMARFNQAKGLTPGEKATLRRKILAAAKKCGIEVRDFAKADAGNEFDAIYNQMLVETEAVKVMNRYGAEAKDKPVVNEKSPCPPGMQWDLKAKKCMKMRGFVESVLSAKADHSDVIALDPAGRKDTVNFKCPPDFFFDFSLRECIPLDSRENSDAAADRSLVPNPTGKPAKLPVDCPKGTIWDKKLEDCLPLDSRDKVKAAAEEAVAQPGNREGLTKDPAGKVKLAYDCPPNTMWDVNKRTCTPLDPNQKTRQGSPGPRNPEQGATLESQVEGMSLAMLINRLDVLLQTQNPSDKAKASVQAANIPDAAFPPSLIRTTEKRRNFMHHSVDVTDPCDHSTVDVARLRRALARLFESNETLADSSLKGYSPASIQEAKEHLLSHARAVVLASLKEKAAGKK